MPNLTHEAERISQEVYCNDCDGFFIVRLNTALTIKAEIRCPSCGRQHPRYVVKGIIQEDGRGVPANAKTEVIRTTMSTYHKNAVVQEMMKKSHRRNGIALPGDVFLAKSWLSKAGSEKGEEA